MSRTFLKKEMKAFYLKVYRKFKICIQHLFFFLTFNITTYVCDIIKKITGNDERTKRCPQ